MPEPCRRGYDRAVALRNGDIADMLDVLGDLYEIDGADQFRVLAYHRAADRIREAGESAWTLSEQGRLTELPGVGRTIAEKIDQVRATGTMEALTKLQGRWPVGLVDVMRLPGVGARTARMLHEQLEVGSLDDLAEAARNGLVRDLPRMGERKEAQILAAIDSGGAPRKTVLLLENALELAAQVLEPLRAHPACVSADEAGSLRRRAETVGDIDLIAASEDPTALTAWFCEGAWVQEVTGRGDTKASVVTHAGVQMDLRVVPPESYGNLLQHFTGSKAHNVAMREQAQARGLKVSEWGIEEVESGDVFRTADEDEVYRHLGYEPIAPELRENTGELEAARNGKLPELVALADIRGDLHTHSDASDGKATVVQMVEAAMELGHSYLAVTDHSAGVGMGIGLDADHLRAHVEVVRMLAARLAPEGFTLLAGCEVDIMADGSLYFDDELLAELDWVVASVHVGQRQDSARITKRLLAAVENENVDVLGHPSGRRMGHRDAYPFDVEAVIARAVECGTFLEINCQPQRLDLRPAHARLAIAAGARLCIATDAHQTSTLRRMEHGVAMARRAWATPANIVNTLPWDELHKLRKPSRRGN